MKLILTQKFYLSGSTEVFEFPGYTHNMHARRSISVFTRLYLDPDKFSPYFHTLFL